MTFPFQVTSRTSALGTDMVRTKKAQKAERGNEPPADTDAGSRRRVPAALARTSVYRRVPIAVRARVDEAILIRPDDCATLDAIAERFDLTGRYGIKSTALRTYARRLEQCVRPAVASQLVTAVLGCLGEDYRRQLVNGTEVLLLSRVVQALSAEDTTPLPVADLAKLASVLSAVAGRGARTRNVPRRAGGKSETAKKPDDASHSPTEPTRMAEAVRMVYGLPWPPDVKDA